MMGDTHPSHSATFHRIASHRIASMRRITSHVPFHPILSHVTHEHILAHTQSEREREREREISPRVLPLLFLLRMQQWIFLGLCLRMNVFLSAPVDGPVGPLPVFHSEQKVRHGIVEDASRESWISQFRLGGLMASGARCCLQTSEFTHRNIQFCMLRTNLFWLLVPHGLLVHREDDCLLAWLRH